MIADMQLREAARIGGARAARAVLLPPALLLLLVSAPLPVARANECCIGSDTQYCNAGDVRTCGSTSYCCSGAGGMASCFDGTISCTCNEPCSGLVYYTVGIRVNSGQPTYRTLTEGVKSDDITVEKDGNTFVFLATTIDASDKMTFIVEPSPNDNEPALTAAACPYYPDSACCSDCPANLVSPLTSTFCAAPSCSVDFGCEGDGFYPLVVVYNRNTGPFNRRLTFTLTITRSPFTGDDCNEPTPSPTRSPTPSPTNWPTSTPSPSASLPPPTTPSSPPSTTIPTATTEPGESLRDVMPDWAWLLLFIGGGVIVLVLIGAVCRAKRPAKQTEEGERAALIGDDSAAPTVYAHLATGPPPSETAHASTDSQRA